MSKSKKARILLYDLESTPNLGYVWGKFEQNVLSYKSESELLSVAWKWLGESKVHVKTRADFKDKTDLSVVKVVHELLDEADLVIAHNGFAFDNKKAFARFVFHKLKPPSPFRTVDTLKIARKAFKFNSNSLNDLCEHLGIGSKVKTGGFELWLACMAGSKAAFKKMGTYNKHDVTLLEKIYLRFRPWIDNHPNLALINDRPNGCPNCGHEHVQSKGFVYTNKVQYRKFQCMGCYKSFAGPKTKHNKE